MGKEFVWKISMKIRHWPPWNFDETKFVDPGDQRVPLPESGKSPKQRMHPNLRV